MSDYLHGYSSEEQERLFAQALILKDSVFRGVHFSDSKHILEVGCGVGAQSEVLLSLFPKVKITAIDISKSQVAKAESYYSKHPMKDQINFRVADATQLPFEDSIFDGVFLCWILEHLSDPVGALKEIRRCMIPGTPIFLNEVFSQLVYFSPNTPATDEYWDKYTRLQKQMAGNPDLGGHLGNLLSQAGFQSIQIGVEQELWDNRFAETRKQKALYWKNLLLSGAPALLQQGLVDLSLIERMKIELDQVGEAQDGVVFFGWIKGKALA